MPTFGMPGPGGSLGQCAFCGKPFLTEILFGQTVSFFTIPGCIQTLFGHDECLKEFDGKEMTDLPAESPLRLAYEKQNASKA